MYVTGIGVGNRLQYAMELWTPRLDVDIEKDTLFSDLMDEIQHSLPGAYLSESIRHRLENLPISCRKVLVDRMTCGYAPLFAACKKGLLNVAEYLITKCGADVERRGIFEVQEDRSIHVVTPLWCAAVADKLAIVGLLLNHGADINSVSDTGSTPVRSACFMTQFDIVRCLVNRGADINKPNYNGGTCLINSVQSADLCYFLILNGANVNATDIQNKTALHYAIQEHQLDTTKLLLRHGADPRAKSKYGDDALRTACLKRAENIFDYLIDSLTYTNEQLASAHELFGAALLSHHDNFEGALRYWNESLLFRHTAPKDFSSLFIPRQCYRFQCEFEKADDLEFISNRVELMHIQAMLIYERILGPFHEDTIFRLVVRGASYVTELKHQFCLDLWRRALEIHVEKDTILCIDTCLTAQAVIRQMYDYNERIKPSSPSEANRRFDDVCDTFKLLTRDLSFVKQLLKILPIHKRQLEFYDRNLKFLTHLINLMLDTADTPKHYSTVVKLVKELLQHKPVSILNRDTLLHLCVSKYNTIKSTYFPDSPPIVLFPKRDVIELLLKCGLSPLSRNLLGSTPLHIAAVDNENFCGWAVELLLENGAHLDQPNNMGVGAYDTILSRFKSRPCNQSGILHPLKYMNLKCLCAKVICREDVDYKGMIPGTLELYVQLHER